jgi:hypothetical protein
VSCARDSTAGALPGDLDGADRLSWGRASMKEAHMVESVQEALGRLGIDDEVVAAGMFFPRGHTGSMFAGGLVRRDR